MFGRRLKASIAVPNGRSAEFIRKRTYENKQRCYECGAGGHLSYQCPANVLGEREPPPPSAGRKARRPIDAHGKRNDTETQDDGHDGATTSEILANSSSAASSAKKPKFKQNAYFSDDEDVVSD